MSNFSELQHLASYVSRHNFMAHDTPIGLKPWKKNRGSATNAAFNISQIVTRLYWNDQLLQGHVASLVAHLRTTHRKKQVYFKKGEKPPPFQWTSEMQKAFDQMKALMAADVLCAYPNHNKLFLIFTDAGVMHTYVHQKIMPLTSS
jgi:hypothetical protein